MNSNSALLENAMIDKVANVTAAGTTEIDSASVDMTGYDRVAILASLDAVTDASVVTLALQVSDNDSDWDDTDAASPAHTGATSSNKFLMIDIARPPGRYVRAKLTRTAQNTAVGSIWIIRYSAKSGPLTQADTQLISSTIFDKAAIV